MSISVVVPAHNAALTLPACLRALAAQTTAPDEIIVVDDGSTDDTAHVAARHGVRCVSMDHAGPAAARNAGARASSGDLLLFTDADCEPAPNWVEEMVRPFEALVVVGVKGTYRTRQTPLLARLVQAEFEDKYERMHGQDWIDFVDTYSAAYRREVFLEAGGFREVFPVASVEDVELSFRLTERGARLKFAPAAYVWHTHPTSLVYYLRRKARYGFWRALVYFWHPGKIRGDSHTDPILKLQFALVGLTGVGALAATLDARLLFLALGAILALFVTTLGFAARAWRRDRTAALIAPPVHVVRAFVQVGALAVGFLVNVFVPSFVARQERWAATPE